MDGQEARNTQDRDAPHDALRTGLTFLQALFAETDTVLFRPIETWTEGKRKHSRVDYKATTYCHASASSLTPVLEMLLKNSEAGHLNVFFGVCPRLGSGGAYDLAWQIRTVRALWVDIDHVDVQEAQRRVADSALPEPSILVHSGNGVHAYWLLKEPFYIDDVGDPAPVEVEWGDAPNGRRKPRKFIVEDGERVFLDTQKHASRLSNKAQHLQDILAGVAAQVGGDHTTDLSRILRIPGSLNRKDERNGREPIATELVICDPSRTYPISIFEPLKDESPAKTLRDQIAAMPLPAPRKLSPSKADKFAERIAVSTLAPNGQRSEADFALCCHAIQEGISKPEVWSQVAQIGKFSEAGEAYFDRTWANAEEAVRRSTFERLSSSAPPSSASNKDNGRWTEIHESTSHDSGEDWERPTIEVDASQTTVAQTLRETTNHLLATKECYRRSEQLTVIHGDTIWPILAPAELAGVLSEYVEYYFVSERYGAFKPFPVSLGSTWLNNRTEISRLPVVTLFTRNPVYSDDWTLVAPGYHQESGIYYAGVEVMPRDSTELLDRLLTGFCFKTPGDRTNYLAMLLTMLLAPRFIGSKPAVLLNGNQPGLGKSILAQIISILRDGRTTSTATYNPNDEEFEKRLGATVRRGDTTIIVDNAKTRGRNPRIESACLERSITDPILSFRLLGGSQEIRAENSHIFCITANAPDVSRDLITRSCVINLHHEGDPKRRSFAIDDPEGFALEHRVELLGELCGMVERWKASGMPNAPVHSRFNKRGWGTIIGGILEANGEPDFLLNADEAADVLDETRRDFGELMGVLADHNQGVWTAAELVELCKCHGLLIADLGEGSPRSLSTKMGTIAGRYVGESFELDSGRYATFHKQVGRKGMQYRVSLEDLLPNLSVIAEPLPNLDLNGGSAC